MTTPPRSARNSALEGLFFTQVFAQIVQIFLRPANFFLRFGNRISLGSARRVNTAARVDHSFDGNQSRPQTLQRNVGGRLVDGGRLGQVSVGDDPRLHVKQNLPLFLCHVKVALCDAQHLFGGNRRGRSDDLLGQLRPRQCVGFNASKQVGQAAGRETRSTVLLTLCLAPRKRGNLADAALNLLQIGAYLGKALFILRRA